MDAGAASIFHALPNTPPPNLQHSIKYGVLPQVLPIETGAIQQCLHHLPLQPQDDQKNPGKKKKKRKGKHSKHKKKEKKKEKKAKKERSDKAMKKRNLNLSNEGGNSNRSHKKRKLEQTLPGEHVIIPGQDAAPPTYSALDIPEGGRIFPAGTNKHKDSLFLWPESELQHIHTFLSEDKATVLFAELSQTFKDLPPPSDGVPTTAFHPIDYRQDSNVLWFGDNSEFSFGGQPRPHLSWSKCPSLLEARVVLECQLGHSFNSVMCCYYKNGAYYTEFSPDDDEFLGPAPGIAMVALGSKRSVVLRPKKTHPLMMRLVRVTLDNACVLYMHGKIQSYYEHAMPPEGASEEPQILLTFRYIYDKQTPKIANGTTTQSDFLPRLSVPPQPSSSDKTLPTKGGGGSGTTPHNSNHTTATPPLPVIETPHYPDCVGRVFTTKEEVSAHSLHNFTNGNIDGSISGGVQSIVLWDESVPQVETEIRYPRPPVGVAMNMQSKLENMMIKKNVECSLPIRVIRAWGDSRRHFGKACYRYDGLYEIEPIPESQQQARQSKMSLSEFIFRRRGDAVESVKTPIGAKPKRGRRKKRDGNSSTSASSSPGVTRLASIRPKPSPSNPAEALNPQLLYSAAHNPAAAQQLMQLTLNLSAIAALKKLPPMATHNPGVLGYLNPALAGATTTMPITLSPSLIPTNNNKVANANGHTDHSSQLHPIIIETSPLTPPQSQHPHLPLVPQGPLPNIAANSMLSLTNNANKNPAPKRIKIHLQKPPVPPPPTEDPSALEKRRIEIHNQQILMLAQQQQQLLQQQQLQQQQQQDQLGKDNRRRQPVALQPYPPPTQLPLPPLQPLPAIQPQLQQQLQQQLLQQHPQPPLVQQLNMLSGGRPLPPRGIAPISAMHTKAVEGNPIAMVFPNQTYLHTHLYELPTHFLTPFLKSIPAKHIEALKVMDARKHQHPHTPQHADVSHRNNGSAKVSTVLPPMPPLVEADPRDTSFLQSEQTAKERRQRADLLEANAPVLQRLPPKPQYNPPPPSFFPPHQQQQLQPQPQLQRKSPRQTKPSKAFISDELFIESLLSSPSQKPHQQRKKPPAPPKENKEPQRNQQHEEETPLFCICRSPEEYGFMICCDSCNEWYHSGCIGLDEEVGRQMEVYVCLRCMAHQPGRGEEEEEEKEKAKSLSVAEEWEGEADWVELGEKISLDEGVGEASHVDASDSGVLFLCYASYEELKAEQEAAKKLRSVWTQKMAMMTPQAGMSM